MDDDRLTDEQRAWANAQETLWKQAQSIVQQHPTLDLDGVFRTLRNLQRSPAERLALGLKHGQLGLLRR